MIKRDKYIYVFFIVLCFLIYGNTLFHDFVLDDKIVISENKNVQIGFAAIPSIFTHTTDFGYIDNKEGTAYRPLPLMSYAIEIGLFGLKPGVFHFFNILFYTLLCLLIYVLLSQYIFPHKHRLFSVFITVIFIIHPLHTEVVSNIKSRDEIFSFLFFILSIIYLFKYNDLKKNSYWVLSILFFSVSLFSKENALIYIVLLPLFLYFFRESSFKKIIKLMLPYVFVLFLFLIVRYFVIEGRGAELTYLNNALLIYDGFIERYVMAFYILLLYLKLLIFPYPLIWDYSYGHFEMSNTVIVFGIISLLIYLAMFVYVLAGFKKKSIFSFTILFYLLSLSMVSNIFFYIGSTMSERFLFIPSFAFSIAIIFLAAKIFNIKFESAKPKFRSAAVIVFSIIFLVLSVYSYSRSRAWENDYTLAIGDYSNARSLRARLSYVEKMYKNANSLRDNRAVMNNARNEIRELLNDFPEEDEVWYMDGLVSNAFADKKNAIESYKKALSINNRHLDALNNLGTIYHIDEEYDLALEYYNRILAIDSSYFLVYGNIGMIYHFLKDYDKALEYYRISMENSPGNDVIKRNYDMVIKEIGVEK